ncbi:MAG: DUF3108 domain-containing protein [Rhizobiaceae bacterium]
MKKTSSILVAALLLCLPAGAQGAAGKHSFVTEYSVEYLGIRVAKSTFSSTISSDAFEVHGSIKSSGLARFFDSTEGTTYAAGNFAGETTRPRGYVVAYTYGEKAKKTHLAFKSDSVAAVTNTPDLPSRHAHWVKVSAKDLKAVVDPLSAALVKADTPAAVCGRTVRVFDGEFRADIVLSASKASPARVPGTEAGAVVCSARLVPVAGYYPTNKSLGYLRDKSRVDITFAQLGGTGIYAPVHASVGTRFGPVTIRTRSLKASN